MRLKFLSFCLPDLHFISLLFTVAVHVSLALILSARSVSLRFIYKLYDMFYSLVFTIPLGGDPKEVL